MGLNDTEITVVFTNPIQGVTGAAVYTSRLDTAYTPLLYAAEAPAGSSEGDPVWRIWKVDISAGSTKLWANGAATFVNKWSEHLILPYS